MDRVVHIADRAWRRGALARRSSLLRAKEVGRPTVRASPAVQGEHGDAIRAFEVNIAEHPTSYRAQEDLGAPTRKAEIGNAPRRTTEGLELNPSNLDAADALEKIARVPPAPHDPDVAPGKKRGPIVPATGPLAGEVPLRLPPKLTRLGNPRPTAATPELLNRFSSSVNW